MGDPNYFKQKQFKSQKMLTYWKIEFVAFLVVGYY